MCATIQPFFCRVSDAPINNLFHRKTKENEKTEKFKHHQQSAVFCTWYFTPLVVAIHKSPSPSLPTNAVRRPPAHFLYVTEQILKKKNVILPSWWSHREHQAAYTIRPSFVSSRTARRREDTTSNNIAAADGTRLMSPKS